MATIKACIFDLDGVIVDTAKYHYWAWRRLANSLGFDFSLEDNERLKGVSRMDSLQILLDIGGITYGQQEMEQMASLKNQWYLEYIATMEASDILPGVKDFILQLKARGIQIALGSASKNVPIILKNLQILSLFDAIIDGNHVKNAKPDPEVFLLAAKTLAVEPSQCIVFEDAQAGIVAAKNAGMRCVGVGSSAQLYDADIVIPHFENIDVYIKHLFD